MTPELSRRSVLGGLSAGVFSAVVASGCSGSADQEARDVLRVGVQSLPGTLDANGSISNAGIQVYYNIYDTLILRDTKAEEPTFMPGLAEEWSQVSDLVWEFRLRSGVKFHDGTDFTADDVAYSMNRVINEEDPSYATGHAYMLSNFNEFEVVDDLTVRVETKETEPLLEHLLSDPNAGISSKAYTEDVGIDQASNEPVATGPYKVASYTQDVELVLEGFADHWSGAPPYTSITYISMPEIASRITALKNDEVDLITNIPPDQESLLEGDERVKLVGDLLDLYHVYRFNMSNPNTQDPALRAALDYAIDREALTQSLWEGKAEPATTYQFTTYSEDLQFPDRIDIGYDPDLARELLADSDYDGGTIRIFNTTDYYTYADQAAQAIVDMWADIGVTAELVQVDSVSETDNEELEIRTWSNPLYYPDPIGFIERHWAPDGEAKHLGHFETTDAYDDAFHTARYDTDPQARAAAIEEIYDYYRDTTPFIYLYQPHESLGMRANIEYVQPKPLRPYCLSFRSEDIAEQTT